MVSGIERELLKRSWLEDGEVQLEVSVSLKACHSKKDEA